MKCYFLVLLYFALNFCQGAYGESDQYVKRGTHSFMAFIYYSDPLVVDISKQRFIRSAVLLRPNWLVTTAIGPSLMDPPNGFPKKTLLARAGAITIDAKFTLNEDEDEQEREIVQIVRPHNHSATQWWTTDISLLKTLLPFKMTSAVGIQTLTFKHVELINPMTCSILVFAKKYGNATEDKNLIVLFVDLLPPSISNCGSHFTPTTMACAADSEDNKYALYDANFCQGNSGGPLLCSNDVVGLQTYIGNNCKQPHLYQLFFPWDNFITCGIEDKCQEENCGSICDAIYKDAPKASVRNTPPVTHDTAQDIIAFLKDPSNTTIKSTTTESITVSSPTVTAVTTTGTYATFSELVTADTMTINLSDVTTTKQTHLTTPDTTTTTTILPESTVTEATVKLTEQEQSTHTHGVIQTSASWPKLKGEYEDDKTTVDTAVMSMTKVNKETFTHDKEVERKAEVEAQRAPTKKKNRRSAADRNMSVFQTVLFGFTVFLCL